MIAMQLTWTLLPYALLTVTVSVLLALIHALSKRLLKLRQRLEKCEARVQTESAQLATGMNALKDRVGDLEEGRPPADTSASMTAAPAAGLNSTVRSKVLKMHRLGQAPEKIADNLRVPKGEVDLLIKVHQIVMRPYEEGIGSRGRQAEAG